MAADKQSKFNEMHTKLFADLHAHRPVELKRAAEEIGLDLKKWQQDFDTLEARVLADKSDGESLNVTHTPTLYINGIVYEGPRHPEYIKMWIIEALGED